MKIKLKKVVAALSGVLLAMQGITLPIQAESGDIQTIFDLSDMYTTANIYNKDPLYSGGNAGYAGAWYYDDFISDKTITWKTPWTEGMTDNILTTANGVDFKLRVVEGNSANCVLRNRSDSNVYTNLDVEDGAYTSVEFLASSDRPSSSTDYKYMGVKLNYSDGTSTVEEHYMNLFANKPLVVGVESRRCRNGAEAMGYLAHVTVKTNPEKELESIDIINDRFEWVTDSSGNYVTENGEYKTTMHEKTNSRGSYKFVTQIYAVTLITNEEVVKAAQEAKIAKQIAEIEDSITALGEIENLQYSQKEDVEKIGELIETAKNDGINVEEKVSNYQNYLDAVVKMEELYREIVYKEIADAIDRLGAVENLEYSRKPELEAITAKIEEAESNGYEVTKETVTNLSVYEAALIRMEELYVEKVLKEIEDKIIALGDINSLTYADQEKLDEIAEMISSAETEGIEVNSDTLSNYDTYIKAQSIVKDLMPVSVPVDISALFNVSNIYGPNGGSVTGSAGYAGRIVYQSMINDLEWKYEWDEERTDNITTVNDVDYKLRVLDNNVNTAHCVFKNNNQTEQYTNIDVEDKNYMAVNILANSERGTSVEYPKYIGVKLNYADGSCDVVERELAYFCNGYGDTKNGITVIRMSGDQNPEIKGYIGSFEIEADYSKVLTSIDIINDCFLFTTDDDGNYVFENGEPVLSKGETDRSKVYHGTQIYAVSMSLPYKQYVTDLKAELEEAEESLDNRYDVSGGVISDEAANIFFKMKEGFEYLDDTEYESGFSNYNTLKNAMPQFVGGSFEENNDVIGVTLEFNVDMIDMKDYITILQGDTEIEKYTLKTEGNKVEILFNNSYNYEDEYKVKISKDAAAQSSSAFILGLAKSYNFIPEKKITVSNIKVTDESGAAIENVKDYSGATVKVSAKVQNNTGTSASYFALLGLYDENGFLVDCKNIANTLAGGKSETVNAELSTNEKTGLTLKVIWLDSADTMKTVFDTIIK